MCSIFLKLTVSALCASITLSNCFVCNAGEKNKILLPSKVDRTELIKESSEMLFEEDNNLYLSVQEIELIALVTMAEAEGECEKGKRLVIDTILNRLESEHYPNTIHDVIYQPSQFSSMWNGRVERCTVREDICQLVKEEVKSRANYDVIFFTANNYGKYGKPMFQIGGHYFSSYD